MCDALLSLSTQTLDDQTVQTVDARNLHAFLGVGKDFSTWIKDRIQQHGFVENQDFGIFPNSGEYSSRGRPTKEYALTIDAAKHISMAEHTPKGKEARQYFIECERRLRALPGTNPPEADGKRIPWQKNPLLAGFFVGATWKRLLRGERQLVSQGVHDLELAPEQSRVRALGLLAQTWGRDPTFLFEGTPIVVLEKKKSRTRKKNTVLPFHPYINATQIANQLDLRFKTGSPNGGAANDLICAAGLAYRLPDGRLIPTAQGKAVCNRRPVLDAQGLPTPHETLTWDTRIVENLRSIVKQTPNQGHLF